MTLESETLHGHVVAVTLHSWVERANKEIDAQFLPEIEDNSRKLIRVIPLETGTNPYELASLIALDESFTKVYKKLLEGASDAVPAPGPPQLVLVDRIKTISGHAVPVYGLETSSIAAGHVMLGPGGRVTRVVEELKKLTFKDETADKLYLRADGRIYNIPGIPPMYDHEQMPQKIQPTVPKGIVLFIETVSKFKEECDGLVANTTALLEGESIRACQEQLGEKPVICPGPFDFPIVGSPKAVDKSTQVVSDFLDSMIKKYGEASVIYISFGSQFWPSEPEKLWAVLDLLLKSETPFIFAHASPFAVVPDEIKDRIEASGIGWSSNWLPQTAILNHKACGWILTHAGQNSVLEALAAGIPLICWPFDADQPVIAANVTFVHNLGYELFEVRNGAGLRPIHRLGDWSPEGTVEAVKREFSETLVKMQGDDGATKPANAQRFRDAFAKLWAPGGENWKEIKRITDILQ